MSEAENKSVARQLLEEVVSTGAVDRLPEFLASDCRNPYTGVAGLAWFQDHLLTFHKCYPDLVVTVDGQVAEEDTVVTWWTMRGTHSGECGDVRPTHKRIVLHGVNIQKFRNGRIVEKFGASDSLEALLELGLVRWATGQQGAAPDGGPATPVGNSGVTEGPPSVS